MSEEERAALRSLYIDLAFHEASEDRSADDDDRVSVLAPELRTMLALVERLTRERDDAEANVRELVSKVSQMTTAGRTTDARIKIFTEALMLIKASAAEARIYHIAREALEARHD